MELSTRRMASVWIAVLATALILAGCSRGDSTDTETAEGARNTQSADDEGGASEGGASEGGASSEVLDETGFVGAHETDSEPQQGGTLTWGVYAEAYTLDPALAPSSGVLSGTEMAAIYDVLVRYDPVAGAYEPWLAEGLESSDDFATWTLHLREGVTFSDGTPLDAQAVVFNFERIKEGRYAKFGQQIASMETPDELTVVFHLKKPWSRFPYALSTGAGRVASPTAVRKWGEDFGTHPVGAGPFVLDHWAEGEELVLKAHDDYWGEGPYLDKVRFVPLGGAQARLDAMEAGGMQAAFLRDAHVVAATRAAGYGGFVNVVNSGEILAINTSEGRAGADPRVRKAIAYAISEEQLNQRVYEGQGLVQKELIAQTSRWATEAEATPYDPEKATALVAEAKADGFDGRVELSTDGTATRQDQALYLQAALNAVGFDVSLRTFPSATALYGSLVEGDYDLGFGGQSVTDAAPWVKLVSWLRTDGSTNRHHWSSPEMNQLLNQLHDATSEEGKQRAIEDIQQLFTDAVPSVPLGAIPEFVAFDGDVRGYVPTVYTALLLSQAWLDQS